MGCCGIPPGMSWAAAESCGICRGISRHPTTSRGIPWDFPREPAQKPNNAMNNSHPGQYLVDNSHSRSRKIWRNDRSLLSSATAIDDTILNILSSVLSIDRCLSPTYGSGSSLRLSLNQRFVAGNDSLWVHRTFYYCARQWISILYT